MSSLTIALSGLQAQQQSMLVTSQNIANAGTEGYSVQRTVLSANPLVLKGGAIFGGVTASAVSSARDRQLDLRILAATARQAGLAGTAEQLSSLESIFGTLDEVNLQTQMAATASAFNDMANDPDDDALASAAVAALDTLASMLNQLDAGIGDALIAVEEAARSGVGEINRLTGELATLNRAIRSAGGAGGTTTEYADQQAQLLQELAGYLQITVDHGDDGSVAVACAGTLLVCDGQSRDVALAGSAGEGLRLVLADTGTRLQADAGLMQTYTELANTTLPGYRAELDGIALGLIDYLGTQQAIGSDGGDGATSMFSTTVFSADQLSQDFDDIVYDAVHGLGITAALLPDLPDSGTTSVMCLNACDAVTGLASAFVVRYDAGAGPVAASRTLQDLVDAINTGSGGGFTVVPAPAGGLSATLVPAAGGFRLAISTTDGRSLDCGTAVDLRPSEGAPASQWPASDAGFSLSGSYDGGAMYDPAQALSVQVTDAGTIGDDADPPTVAVTIPVEEDGVVSLQTITLVLDASHAAGVPIALSYGLEITFDAGVLTPSADLLSIVADAADDRSGLLGALGIDRVLTGTGASDICVAADIAEDPARLATGSARRSGANDIATAMAGLVSAATVLGTSTAVGTAYQRLVSGLGQALSDAESMGEVQSLVLTTLENQRQILIGVDVDEQMTRLIEQQQAYSAAAKVVTMVRENIATLMSILE